MLQELKEITDWEYANHTYFVLNNTKCIGYIKEGTTELIRFEKAMNFSKSRRKFKVL